jgi:F-type H+-transporting ATPase subunit delta
VTQAISTTTGQVQIGQTYAQPLFALALEQNIIDDVKTDLDSLMVFSADEGDFLTFLASPNFDIKIKKELIERVFADKFNELTVNFLMVVIINGRAGLLLYIAQAYSNMWFDYYQCSQVTITVSSPLSSEQLRTLSNRIVAAMRGNIELKVVTEPAIIGGIIIRYGDKVIDNSVRSRLSAAVRTIKNRCIERGRIDEI